MKNRPSSSVIVLRVKPVALSVAVIEALGSTAFDASVTVPVISPVVARLCARARGAGRSASAIMIDSAPRRAAVIPRRLPDLFSKESR